MDWLESLNNETIWSASQLISRGPTDAAKTGIPTLIERDPTTKDITSTFVSNDAKGHLFYDTFFPPPNPKLPPPPVSFVYPQPSWHFSNPTEEQIHKAIKH